MTIRFELYAAGAATPTALWGVVGKLGRLPEWTDAEEVDGPDEQPKPGSRFVTRLGSHSLAWTVENTGNRLIEATTSTSRGRLFIGAKVVPDPLGSRLVLAAALEPAGALARLRARLVDVPALRRRFDRWCTDALRLAAPPRG